MSGDDKKKERDVYDVMHQFANAAGLMKRKMDLIADTQREIDEAQDEFDALEQEAAAIFQANPTVDAIKTRDDLWIYYDGSVCSVISAHSCWGLKMPEPEPEPTPREKAMARQREISLTDEEIDDMALLQAAQDAFPDEGDDEDPEPLDRRLREIGGDSDVAALAANAEREA